MTLTKEQQESFHEAVKPVIKWLNENCHPHVSIYVDPTGAELSEGISSIVTKEFLKD